METQIKVIERISRMEQKLIDACEDLGRIEGKMDKFIDSADTKYASKFTEKVVWVITGTILTAVIVFVLKSVGIN